MHQVLPSEEASTFLRLALLPLPLSLGNTWLHIGEEEKFIVPWPTSIIAPKRFNRDLPTVICPTPCRRLLSPRQRRQKKSLMA